jgi:hypothetical protein
MGLVLGRPAAAHDTAMPATGGRRLAIGAAALLSLVTAWVHFAYTESHFREWWAYGLFFLVCALVQALWAPAFIRWPHPLLALGAILGNLGVVGMYVWSRTIGVPIGPHAGVAEHTKLPDLATTAGEILLVAILLALLPRRWTAVLTNLVLLGSIAL